MQEGSNYRCNRCTMPREDDDHGGLCLHCDAVVKDDRAKQERFAQENDPVIARDHLRDLRDQMEQLQSQTRDEVDDKISKIPDVRDQLTTLKKKILYAKKEIAKLVERHELQRTEINDRYNQLEEELYQEYCQNDAKV